MNFQFFDTAKRLRGILLTLILLTLVVTCIPYLIVRIQAGDAWASVTPSLSPDASRYFARANDVTRGNFFPHNPYFIEHRNDPSPTPSINDALVALPQLLGLSFNTSYYVNIFFWGFLFLALATFMLTKLNVPIRISVIGALWVYLGLYSDMLRPGAMQIVYPLYLLFLIFFYRFITQKDKRVLPLAVVAGLSAYVYIYLFMTVFAVMGVYTILHLYRKNWTEAKQMILSGFLGGIFALPHILHVVKLSALPFYQETIVRMVFLFSHWPQIEAYYYGRWVVLGLLVVYLLRRHFPLFINRESAMFFQCVGFGILIATLSNIVMGRDFDIPVHVARFGIVWYLLMGVVLLFPILGIWREQKKEYIKIFCITILFLLLVLQMVLNFPRAMSVFYFTKQEVVEVQAYRGVIDWLSTRQEAVVLAPEKLSLYLPSLTKQYVLYTNHASLFLMSDKELGERYLLYHAFDNLTLNQFVDGSSEYYGPAPSMLAHTSRMRHSLCVRFLASETCAPAKLAQDFVDVAQMKELYDTYYPNLSTNILQEYAKYHVRYIVTPVGEMLHEKIATVCQPVYRDTHYSICELNNKRSIAR